MKVIKISESTYQLLSEDKAVLYQGTKENCEEQKQLRKINQIQIDFE